MITTREDALKTLGFNEDTNPTTAEIRAAYRKYALQTHPDKIVYPSTATEKQKAELLAKQNAAFIAVGESYQLLSKPLNEQQRRTRKASQSYTRQNTASNKGYQREHRRYVDEEFTLEDAIALFNSLSPAGKIGVTTIGLVGFGMYLYATYKEWTTSPDIEGSLKRPAPSHEERGKRRKVR